jgi:arylsulfatase
MPSRPLKLIGLISALILFAGVAVPTWAADPAKRPNIVIILADDLGFSDIGPYGSEIPTPNLDRLAAEGVRFSQFYNTARCCPTRAALLTGLYPHQAGVGHMTDAHPKYPGYRGNLSKENAVTIAEVLKPAGYSTYMCGKWHVTTGDVPQKSHDNWPRKRGFDRYYGTVKGGGSYYDPAVLCRDDTPITPLSDPEYKPASYYYTDAIADQSARFIHEHHENVGDKPLFLYVAFTSPHWPLHAPADTVAKHKGKYDAGYEPIRAARFAKQKSLGLIDDKWSLSEQAEDWSAVQKKDWEARCMEVYAAQVDRMDAGIGRIVEALTDTGMADNTLLVFLADNGGCAEKMGRDVHEERRNAKPTSPRPADEIQLDVFPKYTLDGRPIKDGDIVMPGPDDSFIAYGRGWANVSNTPFREYKHWTHEGGVSTPLIVHWPAVVQPRQDWERQPGHVIDLMATCVDVAGAKYPPEGAGPKIFPMQGVSLVPAFKGESLNRGKPIFWEHEGNRAVRDGQWKLVAKGAAGTWELYDMSADRTEQHDLAAANPDRVKSMADAWQKWAEASQVLPLNPGRGKNPAANTKASE